MLLEIELKGDKLKNFTITDKNVKAILYSSFTRMLPSVGLIKKVYNKDISKAKVLFIPFADVNNKYYIALCKQALVLSGINKSNITTLTSHTHITNKFDIIFVSGGNVCELKNQLLKINWLDKIVSDVLSGALYIGDSAGAVLLGKTIEHTLEYEPYNQLMQNYNGLAIVNKGIVVHFSLFKLNGQTNMPQKDQECYDAHIKQTQFLGKNNFVTIANNQVIIIKNGKIKNKFYTFKRIAKANKIESSKYCKHK